MLAVLCDGEEEEELLVEGVGVATPVLLAVEAPECEPVRESVGEFVEEMLVAAEGVKTAVGV